MLFLVAWLLICTVLAVDAFAMDVSIVTGTKVGSDVTQDFGKAIITVSPERAGSISKQFEQTIEIKNTYDQYLYFWINPYYPTGLKYFNINEGIPKTVDVVDLIKTCDTIYENSTSYQNCYDVQNGTKKETKYDYVLLNKQYESWGQKQQYFNKEGILIKAGETKQFKINYGTYDSSNKFDIRIWANTVSDYTCILDDKKSCVYSYTIDPSYDMLSGLIAYYKLDVNSTTQIDSVGLHNGIMNTVNYFTNSGKINNASGFVGSGGAGASTNSLLTKGLNDNLTGTSNVCMGGWIKFRTGNFEAPNYKVMQISNYPTTTYITPLGVLTSSTTQLVIVQHDGVQTTSTGFTVQKGYLNFYVFCRDYTNSRVYVWENTTLLLNESNTRRNPTASMNLTNVGIESYGISGTNVFDEVFVYDKILDSDEVALLYSYGNSGVSYPFIVPVTANYTVTVVNQTYNSSVFETQNYQYTINVSWGVNVSNITDMTLNAFNYSYTPTVLSNGTLTNQTWRQYNVSNVRPDLVLINGTIFPFNWTFTTRLDNGTNTSNVTTNINQTVLWAYYPINIFMESQSIETHNTTWNNSYSMKEGNMTGVGFAYTTQYNAYTNVNVTSTSLSQNSTVTQNVTFYYGVPMLNSTDNTKMMSMLPYLNITFNGTTIGGRNTSLTANQGVYKILLTNCSNASITDATTNQFFVRDIITDALLNANTQFNYTVWLTENYGLASLSRNYAFNFTGNNSPRICIYPNGTTYTFNTFSYKADRPYTASLTGYLTSSGNETVSLSNVSSTSTIYLTNASAVQEVIVTVTDQNDNKLKNYSVNAYLYQNATYNLLDTETTNLQGQVRFNLYIYDRQYQFRVYYPNGTLAVSAPTSGGATIISTSFTIKVYLVPQVTIGNVVEMMSLSNSLTFNNATGLVNLSFNDSNNLTSNNCLQIMNMTSGNRSGSVLALNCTTNQNGTLTYNLGVVNGTFVAQYIATRREDGLNYLVNYLVINRNTYFNFQREGIFWSFLLIGTIAAIGLFINPVLGIIFLEFGIVATWWIGILPIGWMAMASIVAAGFFVAFFLGKEQ